jgi:MFS family permease
VSTTPPPVLFWFRLYAGLMTAMYVGCMVFAPVLLFIGNKTTGDERVELIIQSILLGGVGLVLTIVCALPFFLPRKPWVWIYDLVIICIGLSSCCCLPASLPLLIYWVKPETKQWFQQN